MLGARAEYLFIARLSYSQATVQFSLERPFWIECDACVVCCVTVMHDAMHCKLVILWFLCLLLLQ